MLEYSRKTILILTIAVAVIWVAFICYRWNYNHASSELSFNADSNTELRLTASHSNIIIDSGSSDKIEIHASKTKGFKDKSSGNMISLSSEDHRSGKGQIRITLPEKRLKAISISTASGDIDALMISAENISLSATAGRIKLAGGSSDSLSLKCTTGDISITDTESKAISINGTTGDVEAIGISSSSLSVKTVTGDIYIDPMHIETINTAQTSGDTELRLYEEPGTISFDTVSGEMSVNDETYRNFSGKGTIEGAVRSVSGDLSIYF